MPVAVHITPSKMSRGDYERVIGELERSGAGSPEGRVFHAGYGDDEVHMFEVWETREQFDDHRDRLFACLQASGVDAGSVQVHEMHSSLPD